MSRRSTAAIPISFVITLLHAGCCLLPLVLAGFSSSVHLYGFGRYKPLLTILQAVLIIYMGLQIVRFCRSKTGTHSKVELRSYLIGFLIAVAGLVLGVWEPFRTPDQKLAQQRFEYFKNHGQVLLSVEGGRNQAHIVDDLKSIEGVKPSSVRIAEGSVVVSYRKDKISKNQILTSLRTKGYKVAFVE